MIDCAEALSAGEAGKDGCACRFSLTDPHAKIVNAQPIAIRCKARDPGTQDERTDPPKAFALRTNKISHKS